MKHTVSRIAWLLIFVGLVASACQEPPPSPTPTPTPQDIIQQAVARLTGTAGFHFNVALSGAPAYLDPTGSIAFRTAVGDFAAPDKAQAAVRAAAFGLITDINVISIGPDQWQTNLLSGKWEQLPPNWGFNPGALFDSEGLPTILTAVLTNAAFTGREKLEGGPDQELYVITGQVDGERLAAISGGLIGPQAVNVTLWIAPDSYEIIRIVVTEPEPGSEAGSSVWQLDFSNYDQELAIEPPL
ncbi:MAG: LppX_LprAFG lipoprotein [Chloroflexi bacterium]|nr:LppX_LprAFG lipoprotein [Chloroflexota bacterium]